MEEKSKFLNSVASRPAYDNLYLLLFSTIIITLPFSYQVSFYCICITLLAWLVQIKKNIQLFDKALWIPFLIFISLYLIQLIGLIHTDNFSGGRSKIEGKISLLVFPILVFISNLGEREILFLKWVFVTAVTAACLWCHFFLLQAAIVDHVSWTDLLTAYNYRTTYFVAPLKIHPTYLTVFTALSLFFLANLLEGKRPLLRSLILGVALAYYGLVAYEAVSRVGMLIFLLTLLGVSLHAILSSKRYRWIVWVLIIAVVLFGFGISRNEIMYNKFFTEFKSLSETDFTENESSAGQHVKSWYCAVELLWSDHFFFGYGTGDEKDVLGTCYADHHWEQMARQKNDAHNEFLSSGVRHGIIGIGLLLFFFGYTFKRAWETRDVIYLVFLTMFFLTSFAESTLKARTGVIFFSMFNALLYKDNYLRSKRSKG